MPRQNLVELRARPELAYIYSGHTLLATAHDGVVRDGADGLYEDQTRLISRWEHRIDGERLRFVASSAVEASTSLAYYVAPHIKQEIPGLAPEEPGLALRVSRAVGPGLHEDLDIENYTQRHVRCELSLELAADFADWSEAESGNRTQLAPVESCFRRVRACEGELILRYLHRRLDRAVAVQIISEGDEIAFEGGCLRVGLDLEPGAQHHLCVLADAIFDGERRGVPRACYRFAPAEERGERQQRLLDASTRLQTSNATVQCAWDTATGDLADLALHDGGWPDALVPAAGVPGYQALFGRDAITVAWQSAMSEPILMEATINRLASAVGETFDDYRDEQPGRIIQQINPSPLALLGETPFLRYYGDFASPAALLIAIGQYFAWTGDRRAIERWYPAAERVLAWLDRFADADGDGFIEYDTRSAKGQKNQGWKDSSLAIVYDDGSGVPNPLATCELQGYVYTARQQYALALAVGLHKFREAAQLLREASALKKRFNRAFWMSDAGFYAMALDPEKRQVRSISSNPGHCLATGIVDGAHAGAVVNRLMAADMFSGWGVRTLSAEHPAYNPLSYQLGSVWPVEQASIAFGFKRYGFHARAAELARGVFEAAALFPQNRLPELIGGYPRDARHPHPGIYPQAQSPQAWSASAIFCLLQAMLGLRPMAPLKLLFVDPALPDWLPDVTLHGLQVGDAQVTLKFQRRADGGTSWKVLRKRGDLHVVQQPPESSVFAHLLDRGAWSVRSFLPFAH